MSIYPIHSLYCLSFWGMENLVPILGYLGHKAEHTLDRMPILCSTQSHTHSHNYLHTTDHLEMLISLQHVFELRKENCVHGGNPRSTGTLGV